MFTSWLAVGFSIFLHLLAHLFDALTSSGDMYIYLNLLSVLTLTFGVVLMAKSAVNAFLLVEREKILETRLRKSQEKYRSIVDNAFVGVYKTNIQAIFYMLMRPLQRSLILMILK